MKKSDIMTEISNIAGSRGMKAEVFLENWEKSEVSVENGQIGFSEYTRGQGIGIRLLRSKKVAFFASNQIDPDRINRGILEIADLIDYLPETPLTDFAQPQSTPCASRDRLRIPDPGIPGSTIDEMIRVHDRIRKASPGVIQAALEYSWEYRQLRIMNSNAVDMQQQSLVFSRRMSLVMSDAGDKLEWDAGSQTVRPGSLRSWDEMSGEILPLLTQTIGGKPISSGERPVVFHPTAGRGFWHAVLHCLNGEDINRKMSFLANRLNTRIASESVQLWDDPLRNESPRRRCFDAEGIPCRRMSLIENGILKGCFDNLTTATESGRKPGNARRGYTGQPETGWSEVTMSAGQMKPDEIITRSNGGLFITRLLGFGMDPVTGGYSIGASGQMIENGKPGRPVAGITIAGMMDQLLPGIDMIGDDLRLEEDVNCPTFRVQKMMVGGL